MKKIQTWWYSPKNESICSSTNLAIIDLISLSWLFVLYVWLHWLLLLFTYSFREQKLLENWQMSWKSFQGSQTHSTSHSMLFRYTWWRDNPLFRINRQQNFSELNFSSCIIWMPSWKSFRLTITTSTLQISIITQSNFWWIICVRWTRIWPRVNLISELITLRQIPICADTGNKMTTSRFSSKMVSSSLYPNIKMIWWKY